MATADTVYRIVNQYEVRDLTAAPLKQIGGELDRANKRGLSLKSTLLGVGAALGGRALFGAAKSALIDYSSSIEQAKIQTAGLLQLNTGGEFSEQLRNANTLVKGLEQRAKQSAGSTKDMVDMMSRIVRPVTAAGVGMKDLEKMTASAVVAAKAFGVEAGMAAMDIEGALMGNLQKRDRFARALLEPMGWTTETFNALDPAKRAEEMIKALNQPALKNMAKAQENSWAGVTSTLKDNIEIALGKVGLPLMKAMGAEVKKMNDWFDRNGAKVEQIAKSTASALVSGFKVVAETFKFIVDHKTLLLTLAKAWMVSKGVGLLGSGLGALGAFGHGLSSSSAGLAVFTGKLGNAGAFLGKFSIALGLAAAGATAIAEAVDRRQERDIGRMTDTGFVADRIKQLGGLDASMRRGAGVKSEQDRTAERSLFSYYKENGMFSRDLIFQKMGFTALQRASFESGTRTVSGIDEETYQRTTDLLRGLELTKSILANDRESLKQLGKVWARDMMPFGEQLFVALKNSFTGAGPQDQKKQERKAPVNVKIEIPARDPDRFAREFNRAMEQIVARPAAASSVLGGSF